MKYKTIGFVSIAASLMAVVLALFLTKAQGRERYHQHLEAVEKMECSHSEDVFCTHLPLVQINTGGVEIPGKSIDGNADHVTTTADGSSEILCEIKVTDDAETNHHIEDLPGVTSMAYIHVRGNSSRAFDKSGYGIRLVDEEGGSNPQSIMGMDCHHEWVLHGPFLDKTLIRNYMWYNIAGSIMDYTPNVRFCEVILNGEYIGVYVMLENITAGTDGARLSLSVNKKDNSFAGYLLRFDRGSCQNIKNIEPFSVYSYIFSNQANIEYPGADNLTPEITEAIRQDFSAFEKALYSYDYNSDQYGYQTMIDTESFADYFIINELAMNYDAGLFSTYIYKDIDGKFRLCIWDFNSANDNYQEMVVGTEGFQMQYRIWYYMLMKDEDFVEKVISRYRELRETYLSDEYLQNYIDSTIAYLGDAVDRNFEKWGYTFEEEYDLLKPAERNPHSYEEAVEDMKEVLRLRGAWMDQNIETLRQYAAESKVKKYNEHTE